MPTVGTTSKPAYVYDAGSDTWIPIGPGSHTHDYIDKSVITTTGDIIYASAANTPARLGIGSSGNVLTVSGGVPSWAAPASSGGMTLLSTTALSGSSVTVSSISSSYTDLYVEMRDCRTSSDDRTVQIRFNSDSGSNYPYVMIHMNVGTLQGSAGTGTALWFSKTNSSSTTTTLANASMRIPTYKSTSYTKAYSMGYNSINPSGAQTGVGYGKWSSTSAINEITIFPDSGTFSAGTLLIYGVS